MNWRRWFSKDPSSIRGLSTRARARVDETLIARQVAARAALPENSIRPVVRDWPRDANGSPIDYDDFEAPIG